MMINKQAAFTKSMFLEGRINLEKIHIYIYNQRNKAFFKRFFLKKKNLKQSPPSQKLLISGQS